MKFKKFLVDVEQLRLMATLFARNVFDGITILFPKTENFRYFPNTLRKSLIIIIKS